MRPDAREDSGREFHEPAPAFQTIGGLLKHEFLRERRKKIRSLGALTFFKQGLPGQRRQHEMRRSILQRPAAC